LTHIYARRPIKIPELSLVREAFLFSESRVVDKTASVSLFNNFYEVDPVLVGRKVDLVFDPFDLSDITVRHIGKSFGKATVRKIGRHSHPMAKGHIENTAQPSGIDYLKLLEEKRNEEMRKSLNYRALDEDGGN
jgi:putative transposase